MINRCLAVVCLILVSLSSHARFLNQDPAEGNPQNPPSLHKYLYAYSNPAINVDPDGREVVDAVNGATTALTNLLFGGNVDFQTDYGDLTPANREYIRNKTYTQGYLKKRYEVDFRTWTIKKEIYKGPSLGEELKSQLTLGIPELAEKIGTTAASLAVGFDKTYPESVRNKAHYDAGNAIPDATFSAFARKVPKQSGHRTKNNQQVVKEAESSIGTEIAPQQQASFGSDSVGAARVKETKVASRSTPSVDDLSKAASQQYKNGFTKAGHSLQKHGSRPGSKWYQPDIDVNKPKLANPRGQDLIDDVLTTPDSKITRNPRGGWDANTPDKRTVRFNRDGTMQGLREDE